MGQHKGQPSPMDGKNHIEIANLLVAAGRQGMHNPPQKKTKKS